MQKKGLDYIMRLSAAVCVAAGLTLLPTAAFANGNAGGNGNGQAKGLPNGNGSAAANASANANGNGNGNGIGKANGNSATTQPTTSTTIGVQPLSNADLNNTGANDPSSTNQYLSTRDGSPSGNGNGNGNATGKPCAGCVGKADNKNPPGQYPNGSDANAGYECDRNHGIGQSNPAHTGCQSTPTSSSTSSPTSSSTSSTSSVPPTTSPTSTDPCDNSSTTLPSCNTTTPTDPVTNPNTAKVSSTNKTTSTGTLPPATPSAAVHTSGGLAFTGANALGEAAGGLAALTAGGVLLGLSRRRRKP